MAQLSTEGVKRRATALQDYLGAYADSSVPLLRTDLLSLTATLDCLHDYLLDCIQRSLAQDGAGP